jgi:alcohol dehydrogenase class IV
MNFSFLTTPKIVCQAGGLDQLGGLMKGLGVRRALIVTDPGIVKCGFAASASASLQSAGVEGTVFGDVAADPPIAVVQKAVEAARAFKADGIVGLGGGSSLDTAKVVAIAANSEQPIEDMFGVDRAVGKRLPLIQVPTTAGTGSEVTWVSVITSASHEKKAVYAAQLLPDIALLDAKLTLGMPRHITAATGLDAMVHAIEAATSRSRKNPLSDMLAEKALALLGQNLPKVFENPANLEAREAMLLGSALAGIAFINSSVASIHALSYPLGTNFHVAHGHGNALVTAPILRFNLPAAEAIYAHLAAYLLPNQKFPSQSAAAKALIDEFQRLFELSGLETKLSQLGITEDSIAPMAKEVTTGITRLLVNNPRDMSYDDVTALYREVL